MLLLYSYALLIRLEHRIRTGDLNALYEMVRNCPLAERAASPELIKRICAAVDLACAWYWKEVLCLQRSAAGACLLKSHGVRAQLVIGAQQLPFKAHAWVEVDGIVVNDKPSTTEIYSVLDRC